ncbi:Serine/threonine-protein kinase Nek8, partial [Stegodyphus mimosarum]
MTLEERQASMNEAKVLSMLDHPNIIAYHESFLGDKMMVIVMEYVRGGTLFDFLKQRDGELLTEAAVLHYFGQMVYTLQHVHAKLILHRDLKSQNVLLNESQT